MEDIPWSSIDTKSVAPSWIALAREIGYAELMPFNATAQFRITRATSIFEPVLGRRGARHASGFYSSAKKLLATSDNSTRERLTTLKVMYFWAEASHLVEHPVNDPPLLRLGMVPLCSEKHCKFKGE
jgi:hypothetical protein